MYRAYGCLVSSQEIQVSIFMLQAVWFAARMSRDSCYKSLMFRGWLLSYLVSCYGLGLTCRGEDFGSEVQARDRMFHVYITF